MFGIEIVELAIGLVVVFLLEIPLFWAASAVADAPPMGWGKLFLVVLVVTGLCVVLLGALDFYSDATAAPRDPENRPRVLIIAGLGLVGLWAVPAVLYPLLASVSIPRAMWLALLQLLLRGFLYVFLAALFMVGLAVYQILTATDTRPEKVELARPVAFLPARP
jgi:hypothetical protein